jgi:hypothetical protein
MPAPRHRDMPETTRYTAAQTRKPAQGAIWSRDPASSASAISSHGGGYRHMARRRRPRKEPRAAAISAPVPAATAAPARTVLTPL